MVLLLRECTSLQELEKIADKMDEKDNSLEELAIELQNSVR